MRVMETLYQTKDTTTITRQCLCISPFVSSLLLAVADEVAIVTGIDVMMERDEEPLVVLKGTGELLHQLPDHLQELVNDWCHFFGIPMDVTTSILTGK